MTSSAGNGRFRGALPPDARDAQTKSGFHVLVAASGDQTVGSESVALKQGESYTFAVH